MSRTGRKTRSRGKRQTRMHGHYHQSFSTRYLSPGVLRRSMLALLLALLISSPSPMLAFSPVVAGHSASLQPVAVSTVPAPAEPRARTWQTGVVYMQIGSSCVGYALAAWLDSAPNPAQNHPDGWQLYMEAQKQDGIAEPHEGTAMDAAIRVLARLGYVSKWQSTHDAGKALTFLRTQGPILLDADFPTDRPSFDSQKNLLWKGKTAKHAWLCYGVDEQDRLSCQNSGGTNWNRAEGGRFHMSHAALVQALVQGLAWLITKA